MQKTHSANEGSLRGVVADATGAAIPGANATLHSVDQNGVSTITSDNQAHLFSRI
jgi:hypothetical protein